MIQSDMNNQRDDDPEFSCRPGCGACCIAPSLSSPIPPGPGFAGLPGGKPAGLPCPHLDKDYFCGIYGKPERPAVCAGLRAEREMCGSSREEALAYLARLEILTLPDAITRG
jgi:uncharacterized protein